MEYDINDIKNAFADNLKRIRINAGYISASSFAKQLDIPCKTYLTYENKNNIKMPRYDTLVKISQMLGTSLDNLIFKKENQNEILKNILNLPLYENKMLQTISAILQPDEELQSYGRDCGVRIKTAVYGIIQIDYEKIINFLHLAEDESFKNFGEKILAEIEKEKDFRRMAYETVQKEWFSQYMASALHIDYKKWKQKYDAFINLLKNTSFRKRSKDFSGDYHEYYTSELNKINGNSFRDVMLFYYFTGINPMENQEFVKEYIECHNFFRLESCYVITDRMIENYKTAPRYFNRPSIEIVNQVIERMKYSPQYHVDFIEEECAASLGLDYRKMKDYYESPDSISSILRHVYFIRVRCIMKLNS